MRKITILLLLNVTLITLPSVVTIGQESAVLDTLKSMMIKDWERAKAYTQDYMNTMPANKFSFTATDSVRTFAQQLLHLTGANMFFVSTASGEKQPYQGTNLEKSNTAQSRDSVMYYVNNAYDFAINTLKKMPASSLMQTTTLNMGRAMTGTRLSWFLKAFEHQTHHRGQTTIYLRLAGVRPPNERLF